MSNFLKTTTRRVARGFTLVEMLVVVAIIGVLGMVALPAYNNYSTKSKFTEVLLATAPTKTAISACAVSGDCVSGAGASAAINLAGEQTSAQTCSTSTQSVCTTATVNAGYSMPGYSCVFHGVGSYYACTKTTCVNQPVTTCVDAPVAGLVSLPCVGSSGCTPPTKYVASVSYDASGVITATAAATSGLNGETAVLTPSYQGGRVDWLLSGSCRTRSGGAFC